MEYTCIAGCILHIVISEKAKKLSSCVLYTVYFGVHIVHLIEYHENHASMLV